MPPTIRGRLPEEVRPCVRTGRPAGWRPIPGLHGWVKVRFFMGCGRGPAPGGGAPGGAAKSVLRSREQGTAATANAGRQLRDSRSSHGGGAPRNRQWATCRIFRGVALHRNYIFCLKSPRIGEGAPLNIGAQMASKSEANMGGNRGGAAPQFAGEL